MERLGATLRQTREARHCTLEDAEAATNIRGRFLGMLEAGEFSAFPGGEVQARGFLRIYARYLDLSPEEVIARYEAESRSARKAPAGPRKGRRAAPPVQPQAAPPPASRPRWMRMETTIVVGAALIAVLIIVVGVIAINRRNGQETAATALPSMTAHSPLETPAGSAMPTLPVNAQGNVSLELKATEHVWARIVVDDTTVFEGMMASGQVESWTAQESVVVDTGNGAGLEVTINGQSQGAMGMRGEVCSRAWNSEGEIPTPTPASTPAP